MKKPSAPKTVKVLNLDYRIVFVESLTGFGKAFLEKQLIQIKKGLPAHQMADTFIHEVMHAIFWQMDFSGESGKDHVPEEKVVRLTSAGILTFWRDNPDAMRWVEHLLFSR